MSAPLWQNYYLARKDDQSGEKISCSSGCICCVGSANICKVCCGSYVMVPRSDHLDFSPALNPQFGSTEHNDLKPSRFIPFSIFNTIFTILNDGKQLNPHMPFESMKSFGIGRSMLFTWSVSARSLLNLAYFYNAWDKFKKTKISFDFFISLVSVIIALFSLKLYFISLFFSFILLPYSIIRTFAFIFPICHPCTSLLDPLNGSRTFRILKYFWNAVIENKFILRSKDDTGNTSVAKTKHIVGDSTAGVNAIMNPVKYSEVERDTA